MDKNRAPLSVTDWFNEGLRCFNEPDGVGAVRAFEEVVRINPVYRHGDGDNPYFYLGKIAEIEGRIDDAIVFYSRALTLNPHDEESLIGRGSCYTVNKNHKAAVVDFKKVLELPSKGRNSPMQHVLYAIAENYRQQKDFPSALHWGERGTLGRFGKRSVSPIGCRCQKTDAGSSLSEVWTWYEKILLSDSYSIFGIPLPWLAETAGIKNRGRHG